MRKTFFLIQYIYEQWGFFRDCFIVHAYLAANFLQIYEEPFRW